MQYQVETPAEKLFKMSVISIACISLSCCHSFWWRNKSFKSNFDCWSFLVGACLHPSLWNENLNVFFLFNFLCISSTTKLIFGCSLQKGFICLSFNPWAGSWISNISELYSGEPQSRFHVWSFLLYPVSQGNLKNYIKKIVFMHSSLCIVFLFMKLKENFVSRPSDQGTRQSNGMGIWCTKQERQDTLYYNKILE